MEGDDDEFVRLFREADDQHRFEDFVQDDQLVDLGLGVVPYLHPAGRSLAGESLGEEVAQGVPDGDPRHLELGGDPLLYQAGSRRVFAGEDAVADRVANGRGGE